MMRRAPRIVMMRRRALRRPWKRWGVRVSMGAGAGGGRSLEEEAWKKGGGMIGGVAAAKAQRRRFALPAGGCGRGDAEVDEGEVGVGIHVFGDRGAVDVGEVVAWSRGGGGGTVVLSRVRTWGAWERKLKGEADSFSEVRLRAKAVDAARAGGQRGAHG